jgi:hypothetical protein
MRLQYPSKIIKAESVIHNRRLLPFRTIYNQHPLNCTNCSFINRTTNNFCTNCGYPIHPNEEKLAQYDKRLQERKDLQNNCRTKILYARNTLYLLGVFCVMGVTYSFSSRREALIRSFVMLLLAAIYIILGRWTLTRPFTALLISLLLMLTFIAINAWAELSSMFATPAGIYLLVIQIVLTYFLVQGVKAAFHADILEEEFKL